MLSYRAADVRLSQIGQENVIQFNSVQFNSAHQFQSLSRREKRCQLSFANPGHPRLGQDTLLSLSSYADEITPSAVAPSEAKDYTRRFGRCNIVGKMAWLREWSRSNDSVVINEMK